MAADEGLNDAELDVVRLLESNDPAAAEALMGLDETGRARVLSRVASGTEARGPHTGGSAAAVSEGAVVSGAAPDVGALVDGVASGVARLWRDRLGRSRLVVGGVVLAVLVVLIVRSCGGGGGGGDDLLLLSGAEDLYVVKAGQEVDRDGRVARDVGYLQFVRVTTGDEWLDAGSAVVGGQRIVVARGTSGGETLWAIDGFESERLVDVDDGRVTATVVDGVLFVRERSGETERCHRGSPEELDVVFRGDVCVVTRSGHVMGANKSSTGAFRVEVFGPEGSDEELFSGNFESLPRISDNGGFLVVFDSRGVTVTHVASGDEVWRQRDPVDFSQVSHLGGNTVMSVRADDGEVVLVGFDRDGHDEELTELSRGSVIGEFAASGDFYWTEETDGVGTLFMWRASEGDVDTLDDADNMRLAGVHGGAAVTVITDDLGAEFRRYPASGDYSELDDVKADIEDYYIEGDYVYINATEFAAVIPLNGDDAVESDFYDDIVLHDWRDGTLVFSADDGFSTVLVSIRTGSTEDTEYDRFDQLLTSQLDGNTLMATFQDGRAPKIVQFDTKSGEYRDDLPEYNDFTLVSYRAYPVRSWISPYVE